MNIQQLIAQGKTEEALNVLLPSNNQEVILLATRFNSTKKHAMQGLISYQEANTEFNKINYALLEMYQAKNVSVTNITINLTTVKTFEQSISNLPVDKLVDLITKEFTGKPVMKEWLLIKQQYDSFSLLGEVIPEGFLPEVKSKLITLYNKYWTEAENKDKNRIKLSLNNIRESLTLEINETNLIKTIKDFLVIFITEKDSYGNPKFAGTNHIRGYKSKIESDDMQLLKEIREELFQEELNKIHSDLVTCVNRMIMSVEG